MKGSMGSPLRESNQVEYSSLVCMEFFFSHICLVVIVLFGGSYVTFLCYLDLIDLVSLIHLVSYIFDELDLMILGLWQCLTK